MPLDLECYDVKVWDDDGTLVYQGPRFYRCTASVCGNALHTVRQISEGGGCRVCGMTKFMPAVKLLPEEQQALMAGTYKMHPWEVAILEGKEAA
jgi:hypothetical protein